MRVDRERAVRRDVAVEVAHPRVEQPEAAVRAVHVEPGLPLASDPGELRQRVDGAGVHVAGAAHDRDGGPSGRGVLVERPLEEVEVDPPVAVDRDGAEVGPAHPEHAERPADDVVGLRAGVDARLREAGDAVDRGAQAQPFAGGLPRGAQADQVGGRAARGEGPDEAGREAQQVDEPAHRQVVDEVRRRRPPALRRGDRLDEVGDRADRRRSRGHPAAEARVPDPEAGGDDLAAQERQGPLGPDPSVGERLVQRQEPRGAARGRVATLEPQELLERGEDGGEGRS